MIPTRDETHEVARQSWVESANRPGTSFPIQNLPFGVFAAGGSEGRIGVAIGDQILDLRAAVAAGLFEGLPEAASACQGPTLNRLMALPADSRRALRRRLSALLAGEAPRQADGMLVEQGSVRMQLPAAIGDYTDFYASVHHASNVGSMFRPDNPLLPNYKWVPIGYHGRASSVIASGTAIRRPSGQIKPPDLNPPSFGPSRQLDYELELGTWVAGENRLGTAVPLSQAHERLFGVSLLNDWSARDIQSWEYQPLGPFLAKNFATTVSPWVVTWDALAPFRVPAVTRPAGDPRPLPYLDDPADQASGGLDITLEVYLQTDRMRAERAPAARLSHTSFRHLYWTVGQLFAHHASNGCNLLPGDLLGSGTVSGPTREERGCLLELSWRGKEPLTLPNGEQRTFLEDGDEVIMTGWCERPGAVRIGLGECRGVVMGA